MKMWIATKCFFIVDNFVAPHYFPKKKMLYLLKYFIHQLKKVEKVVKLYKSAIYKGQ